MLRPCCSPDGGTSLTSIPPLPSGSACGESAWATEPCSQCVPSCGRRLGSHQRAGKLETLISLGLVHSLWVHLNHEIITCIIYQTYYYLIRFFLKKKKNFFRLGLTCSWFQIEYHAEVESGMFRGSRRAARWHSGLHTQAQTLPRSPRQPSSAAFDLSKLRSNRDQCGFAYKSCFIVYNNCSIFSCLFLALPPPLQLLNQISSSDSSVRCKYGQLLHTIRPNVFHLNLAGCDLRVVTVSFIEVNIVVHHSSFHCTFCAGCCLFVQITDFDPYRTFLLKLY